MGSLSVPLNFVPKDAGPGGVGAIMFICNTGGTVNTGATSSGSQLKEATINGLGQLVNSSLSVSGTWRNISLSNNGGAGNIGQFQRIA